MESSKERKDVIKHRNSILETAKKLFAVHGVGNVNMRQISTTAGIGQGTLYRHYAHKGEIIQDLMIESSELFIGEASAFLDNNKDILLQDRLEALLHRSVEFIDQHAGWLVYMQAPSCEEKQQLIFGSLIYRFLHDKFSVMLAEAQAVLAEQERDAHFRADALLASLTPELYVFLKDIRGYDKEMLKKGLSGLYIKPLFEMLRN
jgi:AcrR family transcriptional regulator